MARIFKGKKEYADKYYYVGQVFIDYGRLKGTYKTITRECKSYEEAARELERFGYCCLPNWIELLQKIEE